MDKKEFYREIMSQYTFDENKIRRNAKRSSSASFLDRHGRWLPLTSAAAVFTAVFSGYMVLSPMLMNRTPVAEPDVITPMSGIYSQTTETLGFSDDDFITDNNEKLSASSRMEEMERLVERLNNNMLGSEIKVMYVTFSQPMSYAEFILSLDTMISDTGIIKIEAVWDGAFINNVVAKANYASDSEKTFTAAKIQAPADLYGVLLEVFEFVDCNDIVNDNNFEPLITESNDTKTDVDITEPAQTTIPESITTQTPIETTTSPLNTKTPETTTTPEETFDIDTSETTAPNTSSDNISVEETPDTTDEMNPIDSSTTLKIPVENVINIEFISADHFIILTKNKVSLNEIVSTSEMMYYKEIASFEVFDPKITYTCKESNMFVILGSDSYNRKASIFIADGMSGTLKQVDVSSITQDASITYAFCNGKKILMKTQSLDSSYFYIAEKDSNGDFRFIELEDISRNSAQAIVVSYDDASFVYALRTTDENAEENVEIFEYSYSDFTSYALDLGIDLSTGSYSFVRSPGLSNFVINNNDTNEAWIWNAKRGELSTKLNTIVTRFGDYDSSIFTDGINWYRLEGLEIEVITESEAFGMSAKPVFSNKYTVVEVTPDTIKIEVN